MAYDFSRKDSPWGYVGACVVCGFVPSEVHHCIPGTANRKKSDKYGLTINLCRKHHREMHDKPNQGLDLFWKQEAQRYYEAHYGTREDFIKDFGRSWL